jgi:hypothetical protein
VSPSKPPLEVNLPPPGADTPSWARVGVVAFLGFSVGVLLPKLAGVQMGPNPPSDLRPSSAAQIASASAAKAAASAALALPVPSGPPAVHEQMVVVSPAEIAKCRDLKGKAPDKCDDIAIDPLFFPRLKDLAKCPSGIGLEGKLSFGLELDFKHKSIKVQRAKGKVPRTTLDGLTRCAEKGLSGISLDDLTHEQAKYSVNYDLAFYPPGKSPPPANGAEPAEEKKPEEAEKPKVDDGKSAEILWNNTLVRDAPKTGAVVAKLAKGTPVKLLQERDGWHKIEAGGKEGWIFHGAIGK